MDRPPPSDADRARKAKPTPAIATIRAASIMRLAERIDLTDRRVQATFQRHGIVPAQQFDPYAILPLANYVALLEDMSALSGDPLLGATMGQGYRPADIGPVGILFSISPSLRVAFGRLARMLPAFQARTSVAMLSQDGRMSWVYKINDPRIWPRRQDAEYAISATCAMVRSSCGPNWRPVEVQFEHDAPDCPATLKRLRNLFRAPVSFGHSANALVLTADDVDRPRHIEDRDLATILEHHIADLVGPTSEAETLQQAVRTVLDIHLGHRPLDSVAIADALGMPLRTLQRRLTAEGSCLRDIIREHRRATAEYRLASGHVPIARLAETLGYADGPSFSRAFRGWTGTAPSRTRA